MVTETINIFLSSRFANLREYRQAIKARINEMIGAQGVFVIDLDDGQARAQPPKDVCLAKVRDSEFMLLLLDDSYGDAAPGSDYSFTHLEYLEAVRDESSTKVLAYYISAHPIGAPSVATLPPQLQAWRKQIQEWVTPGYFDLNKPPEAVAAEVFKHLNNQLHEWRRQRYHEADIESAEQSDEVLDIEDRPIDGQLLDELETRHAPPNSRVDLSARAIKGPNAAAAEEQAAMGERAAQLGELELAITHFSRSLELMPLQPRLQYRLATLLLAQANRPRLETAATYLEHAARVFKSAREYYWAAASLVTLGRVRLALDPDNTESAIQASKEATDLVHDFRTVRYEHSRLLALVGKDAEALGYLDALARPQMRYYAMALRDPAFDTCKAPIENMLRKDRERMQASIRSISELHNAAEALNTQVSQCANRRRILSPPPRLPQALEEASAVRMVTALSQYNERFVGWIRHLGYVIETDSRIDPESRVSASVTPTFESQVQVIGNVAESQEFLDARARAYDEGGRALVVCGFFFLWLRGTSYDFTDTFFHFLTSTFFSGRGILTFMSVLFAFFAAMSVWTFGRAVLRLLQVNTTTVSTAILKHKETKTAAEFPDTEPITNSQIDWHELRVQWVGILHRWENAVRDLPTQTFPFKGLRSIGKARVGEVCRLKPVATVGDNLALVVQDNFDGDTPGIARLYVVRHRDANNVNLSRNFLMHSY